MAKQKYFGGFATEAVICKENDMFFKSEKKKSSAPIFMAVGALAALGAWCIFTKGRELVMNILPASCTCHGEEDNKG